MALTDNLIAYWKLDEASGSRADSHGSNTLTDNNTVTQAAGILGNAAQFTAANSEYLSHADNADLSVGDIDFSITGWVYADTLAGADKMFVGKGPANGADAGWEYLIVFRNSLSRFAFDVSDGTTLTEVLANNLGVPSTGVWYFIAVWHDSVANTINISINNGAVNSSAWTTGSQNTANGFAIGRGGDYASLSWNGRIDSVGFWKRVLTSGEITTLYNGGAGLEYPWITFQPRPSAINILSFRHNQRVIHRLPGFPSQQNTI